METDQKEITEESQNENSAHWEWASAIAEGIPPSARGGHTATLVNSSIVIFGGHYYSDKNTGFVYLNDTHFLEKDKGARETRTSILLFFERTAAGS